MSCRVVRERAAECSRITDVVVRVRAWHAQRQSGVTSGPPSRGWGARSITSHLTRCAMHARSASAGKRGRRGDVVAAPQSHPTVVSDAIFAVAVAAAPCDRDHRHNEPVEQVEHGELDHHAARVLRGGEVELDVGDDEAEHGAEATEEHRRNRLPDRVLPQDHCLHTAPGSHTAHSTQSTTRNASADADSIWRTHDASLPTQAMHSTAQRGSTELVVHRVHMLGME